MISGPTTPGAADADDARPHLDTLASPQGEASRPAHLPLPAPRSAWSTIWRTIPLVWIPQTAIWYVVVSVYPGHTPHDVFASPGMALILGCVIGPYVETHLMRLVLFVLGRALGREHPRLAVYTAAVFGVLHVPSDSWGLHAVWAFYIFTRCYQEQVKYSVRRAVWVTTAAHAGCNLVSYLGTLILRSLA